jgi:peroxiredoxin
MKKLLIFFALIALITARAWAQLPAKAEDVKPLLIGQKVPSVQLKDSKGQTVDTKEVLKQKTILVVYRGGWCPYCTKQLAGLREVQKEALALGYQIVGVSPDSPENLTQATTKNELGYTLLSDGQGLLIKALGLAFQVPKNYEPLVDKSSNGVNKEFLPVPAVYVLNEQQEVEFMFVNPDFKKRLQPNMLLAVLKAI